MKRPPTLGHEILRLIELAVMLVVAMAPMFWFANSVGPDEFQKGGFGIAIGVSVGAVAAIYRLWRRNGNGTK